jgi:putative glycosyltransferase (TIGR04372 family)
MAGERQFIRRMHGLIVARPNAIQYGHLAMEILMAFDEARRTGLPIYFLRERDSVNPVLYEIDADGVSAARPASWLRQWLRLRWSSARALEVVSQAVAERSQAVRGPLTRALREAARQRSSKAARRLLRGLADRTAVTPARHREGAPYMKRLAMRAPFDVRLSSPALARAQQAAAAIGVLPDARLVVMHARESGFKRGREVHDAQGKRRSDELRNADIQTYFEAADRLVQAGCTVVRVGDPSMAPIHRAGIIDVATHPRRVPELDLHLLLRSRFAVVGESGPGQVALLTNTPTLTVNATDPVSSFPIRTDGVYILKRVRDLATGRELSLREMLTDGYLRHLRDPGRFLYIDNSPEEIAESVEEIRAIADGHPAPESPAQMEFKRLVLRAAEELRTKLRYIRKFGAHDGFIGDGRIGRAFVERYW